jgi:hypothetical protein
VIQNDKNDVRLAQRFRYYSLTENIDFSPTFVLPSALSQILIGLFFLLRNLSRDGIVTGHNILVVKEFREGNNVQIFFRFPKTGIEERNLCLRPAGSDRFEFKDHAKEIMIKRQAANVDFLFSIKSLGWFVLKLSTAS